MKSGITVIGLGHMGGAMARNLLSHGYDVRGYDVAPEARAQFVSDGGKAPDTLKEAIVDADLILTSLPTAGALRDVARELLANATKHRVLIETSTFALDDKHEVRALLQSSDCAVLDCPVSGTAPQAVVGDLTVFGSGGKEEFEIAKPALQAIARSVLYIGDFGSGSTLKFIANHLVTIHNTAAAEALTLAKKAGLDPLAVYEALKDSAATSKMFQVRGPMIAKGEYSPAMRIATYQKDLHVIGSFATKIGCPLPVFNMCSQLYTAAHSRGDGGLDTAAVARVLECLAGI
jgi:L-threonate 2-dehydrogenase